VAFERLKSSIQKLRGRGEIEYTESTNTMMGGLDRTTLEAIAQQAAKDCSPMCRAFIKGNMAAKGINSKGIAEAIDRGVAYYNTKKGTVRFRLNSSYNPYPSASGKDNGGVWMVAASQDAGRVIGIKAKAHKAKRRIKAGLADEKTFRAVRQVHNGRVITREAISAAGIKIVPPKEFFEFTAGQDAAIRAKFRKSFAERVRVRREGK
jgi:hypothetical protein